MTAGDVSPDILGAELARTSQSWFEHSSLAVASTYSSSNANELKRIAPSQKKAAKKGGQFCKGGK
jgi:hypothetical protein